MTKKIPSLHDYISASEAARSLSAKLARPISPDYIHRLKKVRSFTINKTTKLYHRGDIEAATVRQKEKKSNAS